MYDVVALGEVLMDMTPHGCSEQGNQLYEANPGGAPCNVLAMLSKAGKRTGFIGKVGKDIFGYQLKAILESEGIDTKGLCMSDNYRTTLAFVNIDETGERDFAFYRNPGADMMLTKEDINKDMIKNCSIFHFGTLSMTNKAVKEATQTAVSYAKEHHKIISFDPNLRPPLWNTLAEAKQAMRYGCALCDILKIEDEELMFMTDTNTIEQGVAALQKDFRIKLILVTRGAKGSMAFANGFHVEKNAYLNPITVDTTGAGDTFCGCCLSYILDHSLEKLIEAELMEMLSYANAAASIVTTRRGAIKAMPSMDEIQQKTGK